jgi:dTDP-4-amino-4,6-dideoxygalactose transaminase
VAETQWAVPLSDVLVDDELSEAAVSAFRSGWWSMGPRVAEFEQAFSEACAARHALAVSNGTAALHLALLATGCGPGDDVIVPSLNFVAAANAITAVGATPVFCDILGEDDLNLDPADVEAAITPRTKAVLVLHYGGHPCDMGRILELAHERGLVVIEDAAHAPGATWQGRACGTLGAVGCFSFFSNKNLPIGEGGAVVTDDDHIAERIRRLRSHGMTTLTWDRHRGHAHTYDVVVQGFNYRLDELRAAVALVQLARLPAANAARGRLVARYRSLLQERDGIVMPFEASQATAAHHLAVVVLPVGISRDTVREALRAKGIQTSVHYPPTHRFSLYAKSQPRSLPRTDDIAERLITLPLFPHMADDQVDLVAAHVLHELQVRGRRRSRARQAGQRTSEAAGARAGAGAGAEEMASTSKNLPN